MNGGSGCVAKARFSHWRTGQDRQLASRGRADLVQSGVQGSGHRLETAAIRAPWQSERDCGDDVRAWIAVENLASNLHVESALNAV